MTCLHNHDQILEFLRKIFLKGFQIYQNYLCALIIYINVVSFAVWVSTGMSWHFIVVSQYRVCTVYSCLYCSRWVAKMLDCLWWGDVNVHAHVSGLVFDVHMRHAFLRKTSTWWVGDWTCTYGVSAYPSILLVLNKFCLNTDDPFYKRMILSPCIKAWHHVYILYVYKLS